MSKKHVLITGGNKGIGLETTKLLLQRNFVVTILARDFTNFPPLEHCNCIEFDLRSIDKISVTSYNGDIDTIIELIDEIIK